MPAETPSGISLAATAWLAFVAQGAAMVATGVTTGMKIEEGISDYTNAIAQEQARIAETEAERDRRIATTKGEGVLALKEQGAQSAYESRLAYTQAELTASAVENKLGASGVRQTGSPLLAAQQQVDIAYAQADRTMESGQAAMTLGGMKLGGQMADITAASTLATNEYNRRQTEMRRKKTYLEENKAAMVGWAAVGGAPGLAASFYDAMKATS
jgi:hypothetical protein